MAVSRRTLEHQGRQRRYTEVTGDNPAPKTETLVLFLHGSLQSGSVARNFTAHTFDALATDSTTVLYPDGVGRHFNDLRRGFSESARTLGIDDVGFLLQLIAAYDPAQVIGCGFSNGGQMLLRMLCEAPSTLAGVALFGSAAPTDDNMICSTERWVPTPILSVQGTADPIVPYDGGLAGISEFNRGKHVRRSTPLAFSPGLTTRASTRRPGPSRGCASIDSQAQHRSSCGRSRAWATSCPPRSASTPASAPAPTMSSARSWSGSSSRSSSRRRGAGGRTR